MAEKTISLSNLTAYNDKIKATYQAKTDNTLTTTNKTVVGAINENKTQLDNITTDLNGYKFVDTPSEGEKEIYLVENTSPTVPTITTNDKSKVLAVKSDGTGLEYVQASIGGSSTVTWNDVIEKPTSYPPSAHRHSASEIDNLATHTHQLVLNGTDLELYIDGVKVSTTSLSGLGGGGTPIVYGNIVIDKTSMSIAEGGTATFTVALDKAPTNNQVVTISKDNTDVTLDKSTLTFTPSNYSAPQTVTITVAEDVDVTNETCVLTLISPNVVNKTIDINITDNGGTTDPNTVFTVNKDIDINSFTAITSNTIKGTRFEYYNYLATFKVSTPSLFSVVLAAPTASPTSDYLYLVMKDGALKLIYSRSGSNRINQTIDKPITTSTIFKFVRNNKVNSLYIDDELMYEYNEEDFSEFNPNYIKTSFGVSVISPATEADTTQLASLSVKYKPSECVDISKSDVILQSEITNYTSNPSQYYAFDDFNRANGSLTTTTNGLTYTTDSTMPTISTNMANANANNRALLDIGSSEYTIYADLRASFNGHYLYLRYVDSNNYIALSFGGNDKTTLVRCISGTKTTIGYTIFNTSTEKYIVKADVRVNKVTINCNNQDILKDFDISGISSTKVGFGANLANCKFDTFIVKK